MIVVVISRLDKLTVLPTPGGLEQHIAVLNFFDHLVGNTGDPIYGLLVDKWSCLWHYGRIALETD